MSVKEDDAARLRAAFREAGHAAALLLGVRFHSVGLARASGDGGGDARPLFPVPAWVGPGLSARARDWVERRVAVCLAGPEAEALHSGRRGDADACPGHAEAAGLAGLVCHAPGEAEAYLAWLRVRARGLLRARWAGVGAVADALLRRKALTEKMARAALHGAGGQA